MRKRIRFILVDALFLHKGSDLFRLDQAARTQLGQRCQDNKLRVYLKKVSKLFSAITATKPVGSKGSGNA